MNTLTEEQRQYHAAQLVRIADLMESCADDDSRSGRSFYKELCRDYKAHSEALFGKQKPKLRIAQPAPERKERI